MDKLKVKLVEQLLDLAGQDHKFDNSAQRLLYERGYLTGLLSALMSTDFYAEEYIQRRIRQLQNQRRK